MAVDPASIMLWIALARQGIMIVKEVVGILRGPGGSARAERYRRFNEAMKKRRAKESEKTKTSDVRILHGG